MCGDELKESSVWKRQVCKGQVCVEESWRRNQVCVECENESGLYSTVKCMEESS